MDLIVRLEEGFKVFLGLILQIPPTALPETQLGTCLKEMWENGTTTAGNKEKISSALEATGLGEKLIRVCYIPHGPVSMFQNPADERN